MGFRAQPLGGVSCEYSRWATKVLSRKTLLGKANANNSVLELKVLAKFVLLSVMTPECKLWSNQFIYESTHCIEVRTQFTVIEADVASLFFHIECDLL